MKLPIISWLKIIKLLTSLGFSITRQSGSHIILTRKTEQQKIIVVVPKHKQLARGTLLSITNQSGIEREYFLKLLRKI